MKFLRLLVAGMILLFAVAGCGQRTEVNSSQEQGFPVELTDITGQVVKIVKKPERIVSLTPSNTEILFALGLDDQIVGVTSWCDYPEKAKEKEKIGDLNTNVEKVVALKPDLVVASASMNSEAVEALRNLGLTVLAVDPQNVEQVFDAIEMIAKVTGTEKRGQEIIADMQKTLSVVKEKIAKLDNSQKARVFIEVGYEPLYTAGQNTFVDDIVRLAGGINVVDDLESYQPYSLEQLLAKNPQVILTTDYYYLTDAQKIPQRPGWQNIDAVNKGRIIDHIDANLLSRPSPRSAEAVQLVAKALYPELFE